VIVVLRNLFCIEGFYIWAKVRQSADAEKEWFGVDGRGNLAVLKA